MLIPCALREVQLISLDCNSNMPSHQIGLGYIIWIDDNDLEMTTPFFGRRRDFAIYVSRLLKVVEGQIWA